MVEVIRKKQKEIYYWPVMQNAGSALMGIGYAIGEKRAETAARLAINSPLLEVSINGAKGVLFSIAGGEDLGMLEVQEAANVITEAIDPDAKVIFGAVTDDTLKKGQVKVTVIATGFPEGGIRHGMPGTVTPVPTRLSKREPEMQPIKVEKKPTLSESIPVDENKPSVSRLDVKPSTPQQQPPQQGLDDDDSWSSFPSFLRRK